MAIRKIDHLYVETRDFDKALRFWSTLGFEVKERWGEDGHQACRLEAGDARVVLAEDKDKPVGPTVHFQIEASAAEALDAALAASADVKVQTALEDTHWNTKWIRVEDPDGNVYSLEVT